MDDNSPLAMQFKEFDDDADNKLTPDQVYELLKLIGKNIYKGSVSSAAKMLNYQDENPTVNSLFTFSQFKQFLQSLDNPLKHDIWKGKYKILETLNQIKRQMGKTQQNATAAPGAKPTVVNQAPCKGDIQIKVGPTNQAYNSYIHVSLDKTPKAQSKPFIKIIFQQSSTQKAKQLQIKFKTMQTNLFQLLKSSDPQSAQVLDYIHIITNVAQNKLNVFVTTSNQALIELGTLASQFLDQSIDSKIQAHVDLKYQFNVDINKFLDQQSNYSFYHALTQNYHAKLVWNAYNFKQGAKSILKIMGAFDEFKYDKIAPHLITLIGILHTEICEINLAFDNAQINNQVQLETKNQIIEGLKQLNEHLSLKQNENLGIFQAASCFENKLSFEASIGDWKAQVQIKIQDLKQLITSKTLQKTAQQVDNQQMNNLPQVNINELNPNLQHPMLQIIQNSNNNANYINQNYDNSDDSSSAQKKSSKKSASLKKSTSVKSKKSDNSFKKPSTPTKKLASPAASPTKVALKKLESPQNPKVLTPKSSLSSSSQKSL